MTAINMAQRSTVQRDRSIKNISIVICIKISDYMYIKGVYIYIKKVQNKGYEILGVAYFK